MEVPLMFRSSGVNSWIGHLEEITFTPHLELPGLPSFAWHQHHNVGGCDNHLAFSVLFRHEGFQDGSIGRRFFLSHSLCAYQDHSILC